MEMKDYIPRLEVIIQKIELQLKEMEPSRRTQNRMEMRLKNLEDLVEELMG